MQPLQVLVILLLCGLIGIFGQGFRAVVGLKGVTSKTFLGVAAAGYARTDFIENTFSIIFSSPSKTAAVKPDIVNDANVQALGAHVSTLNATVSSLTNALGTIFGGAFARVVPPTIVIAGLALALNTAAPDTNVWVSPLSAPSRNSPDL